MSTTVNYELAEKVLRSVLAFPEEHNQDSWFDVTNFGTIPEDDSSHYVDDGGNILESRHITLDAMTEGDCGTSACIAGWAALHDGWTVKVKQVFRDSGVDDFMFDVYNPQGLLDQDEVAGPDFEDAGAEALGLSGYAAHTLFYTMGETEAIISLYSLVTKGGIHELSLFDVAEEFGIKVSLSDDFDDGYEEAQREVIKALRQKYPLSPTAPASEPVTKEEPTLLSL